MNKIEKATISMVWIVIIISALLSVRQYLTQEYRTTITRETLVAVRKLNRLTTETHDRYTEQIKMLKERIELLEKE